ncbi:MAG TPA: glycosyltransferase family 4 protein [Candidatus Tectomicrobia bacterium]|nr:glycosyltransferase family 4 protein [Candidatus Tectomicrobia bacterium]
MKICYLCADRGIWLAKHNGASAHFRSLVRTFSSLGHEVVALTPSTDGSEDLGVPVVHIPTPEILEPLFSEADDLGVTRSKIERPARRRLCHALGHLWNNILVEQTLRNVLPRYRPNLLFEVYSPYGVAGCMMTKRLGIPYILNVHAPLAWEGQQYRQQALQEAAEGLEEIAFAAAPRIITNSCELRDQLVAAGVAASKVTAIPNGVDVEMFSPDGPTYHKDLEGKLVIGFVGSLKRWHGLDILAEAFRRLAADPRVHLLVVGDGPEARVLHSLAAELPGRITLVGAVPMVEVPAYIRAMDIAVAPYPALERFYFSPLKVLEYLAAGRAVVASGIGQLNELIRDGETGLLVPPGDPAALAEALGKLAADQDLRQTLGAAAAVEARRAHTWRQRASEILALAEVMP